MLEDLLLFPITKSGKCWSNNLFFIRCNKSFTLLKLLKLMFFFSLLQCTCHSMLFVSLHWFEYPSNEERKIKKSPELQHQWILSVHSLFWQWLIISPETRACLHSKFRMREKWGGTLGIRFLAMEEKKKGGKGRSWLITNNYSFLIKLTSNPADSKTLSTFSIPSSLVF